MNDLTISVVVASYNDRETLRDTVDSVLNQSIQPIEVLVVDDAGPAPAAEILGDDYPSVRILRHAMNKSIGGVRNTGFAETTGDAILFLDGDDILSPAFLE